MGSPRHHPANHQSRQPQHHNRPQAPSQLRRRTPPSDFLADATTPQGTVALNGVLPGTGVPNLIGTDRVLTNGSPTSSNFRFGDYSSVEVDPTAASGTCPAGRTAVTNQEYFTSNGQWSTRLARTSFC